MAIDTIAITPGSGQLLDAVSMSNGTNTVDREAVIIGDYATFANKVGVTSSTGAPGSVGALQVSTEGLKATYRAFASGFTPVTSAISPSFSLQGSSTKTVKISRIRFSMKDATGSATPAVVSFQRFSALSGGTAGTTPSPAQNDTTDSAATAVCKTWSTLNTTATAVGGPYDGFDYQLTTVSATTAPAPQPIETFFGIVPGAKPFTLRGTSDWFGIVINGVGTTPLAYISTEWTEE